MAEGGRDEGGFLACNVSFLSAFDCGNGLSCDGGGETASCNSSESVNGGRGGCCSVGDALLLRGCYCSGSGDSQGVKPQRRNLQHGEDDMRRVFGIMIMCLVAERRRLLRGRLAGNQGARQKKRLRMSFLVADRLLLFVARGSWLVAHSLVAAAAVAVIRWLAGIPLLQPNGTLISSSSGKWGTGIGRRFRIVVVVHLRGDQVKMTREERTRRGWREEKKL